MSNRVSFRSIAIVASSFLVLIIASGCSDNNNNNDYLAISTASVAYPPDEGSLNLLAQSFDLADIGYEDAEYFIAGTATAFTNVNELAIDGNWQAEPAEVAQYNTRIVVHRPLDPAKFSGTVMVEWLNVTSGFDIPPSWGTGHVEMYRSGHIWVGVSAQLVGIEGTPGGLAPLYLKAVNPARYGQLNHPGDSFSYDIFTQVAGVLRNPQAIDVLDGLQAEYLLAIGESQSAARMVTYINAIQPLYRAYDGFIVHSRGATSSALSQSPQTDIPAPRGALVRTDSNVPVMTFQTETDVVGLGYVEARQDDSDNFILWEVPGTAHADYYSIISGRTDSSGSPQFAAVVETNSVPGFINCGLPFNAGPMHYVFQSALRAMDGWIRGGEKPPAAARMNLVDNSTYAVDSDGNVSGGIRTPYLDAASAVLNGNGNSGDSFCRLFGITALFSPSEMASRYVDQDGFVSAVTLATEEAVRAGFILVEDGDAIIEWAPQQWQAQQ